MIEEQEPDDVVEVIVMSDYLEDEVFQSLMAYDV